MPHTAAEESFYSPGGLYELAHRARHYYADLGIAMPSDVAKAVLESEVTACFAYDWAKVSGEETWLRPVDPGQQAPDVEVVQFVERNQLTIRDELLVEVVSYTSHSPESLPRFLKRTKLDGKRAYQKNTMILVYLERNQTREEIQTAIQELGDLEGHPPVFVLSRVDDDLHQYLRIYPNMSAIRQVRITEMLGSDQALVCDVRRGMKGKLGLSAEKLPVPNPFIRTENA